MAKAKKTESAPAAKKKSPAKSPEKSPAKAPAKSPEKAKPSASAGVPLIDTNLAAQSAARMLSAGLNKPPTNTNNPPRQESALFKQMKAGLNKPHAATMSNLLEKSQGPEPTKSHPQTKQVGRDQTFSADVTRTGVPRRTPG